MKTRTNINDRLYNVNMRAVLAGLAVGYDLKTLKREHALARVRLLEGNKGGVGNGEENGK